MSYWNYFIIGFWVIDTVGSNLGKPNVTYEYLSAIIIILFALPLSEVTSHTVHFK